MSAFPHETTRLKKAEALTILRAGTSSRLMTGGQTE